jgi:hypothetical protein
MAKIETDIGINVGIENAPAPQDGNISTATSQIVGKNSFQELASIFATINPAIKDLAQKKIEEDANKQFELGKAKINGMTLAEAEAAHKQGFPSIMNGWAKYGAHKQYAVNSIDGMISSFKEDYLTKRNDPNYDWRAHYDEYSSKFLLGKEGDELFATAFNEQTANLRKWLNVKEFEKQEDKLKYTVIGNTSYQIQSLPEQVEQALEDNMSKTYLEMFNTIKENKNPALSLAEFDDIVINEAELHADLDGRFSAEFIELLTQGRPDGTPAIINNPKYQTRVTALVEKLRDSIQLQANTVQWWNGELASTGMSKTERVEVGAKAFEKEMKNKMASGMSNADAFLNATMTLIPAMAKNEPIKQIVDLFDKPLSSAYTEDAKLAFEVYAALDQRGLVGMYFEENDKNKYKYFIGDILSKAGVAPQDIIRQLGTMDNMTKTITELTSANKKELQSFSGNMAYAPNIDLVYTVAEYFKNINTDVNDNFINQTKEFVNKYYENINGRYVSKYKLNQFGVTKDNYDAFKVSAMEILTGKLNDEKQIIQETSIVGFEFDETNPSPDFDISKIAEGSVDLNKFELIVNSEGDTLYFKADDSFMTDVPATVEYKDGRTVWLEVPIQLVRENLEAKRKKQEAKDLKIKKAKDKKLRLRKEKNEAFRIETETMYP